MRRIFLSLAFAVASFIVAANVSAFDEFNLWSNVAPGEKDDAVKPTYQYWKPAEKKSDACMIVCPGGGYQMLCADYEGEEIAEYFNSKGITAVVLKYRVPRREGLPKHLAAWQDAQRMVRVARSNAEKWGINPDKIGIMGFSAGGHLSLMIATTSSKAAYEPIDELDKIPCNVNFAAPVYPAYVLQDGADGQNAGKGNDSPMVDDFAFDDRTPPMCLLHGDADVYSSTGSVAVYCKLRKMGVPAELHIYANAVHGFILARDDPHTNDWLDRIYAWMNAMKF